MIVLDTEQLIMCDIDDTLLMWGAPTGTGYRRVRFVHPRTGALILVVVNQANMEVVMNRLSRGATFVFWSASGGAWAKAAVDALDEAYDLVTDSTKDRIVISPKPLGYIDDKSCEKWMGDHIYLDMDNMYGRR